MSSSQTSSSSTEAAPAATSAFSGMLDLRCRVEAIVGTGTISVRDCLELQPDSVIRLVQAVGSDLRVLVQGVPAAVGEIVIDEDATSIRITSVLPPPGAEAQS